MYWEGLEAYLLILVVVVAVLKFVSLSELEDLTTFFELSPVATSSILLVESLATNCFLFFVEPTTGPGNMENDFSSTTQHIYGMHCR